MTANGCFRTAQGCRRKESQRLGNQLAANVGTDTGGWAKSNAYFKLSKELSHGNKEEHQDLTLTGPRLNKKHLDLFGMPLLLERKVHTRTNLFSQLSSWPGTRFQCGNHKLDNKFWFFYLLHLIKKKMLANIRMVWKINFKTYKLIWKVKIFPFSLTALRKGKLW